jgi:hypothetical protein
MADLFMPKEEDTTITIHADKGPVNVDITHIQELIIKAYDQAEKSNTDWQDHFTALFQMSYGVRLNRTVTALLINKAQEMLEDLKKSCFESPSSSSDTTSQSPSD